MSYNWPKPGCVGLWRYNNSPDDDSGQGNNGVIGDGGAITYSLGKFGNCVHLMTDCFILTYSAALKVADFTISAWYRGTDSAARSVIFSTGGVYIGSPSLYFGYSFDTHSGKVGLVLGDTSYTSNTAVNDDKWHFIMATRNNSVARIYVDGRIDMSINSPPSLSYYNHRPAAYYWAGSFVGTQYVKKTAPSVLSFFPTCYLDELSVLNYTVTSEEALDTYLFQMGLLN